MKFLENVNSTVLFPIKKKVLELECQDKCCLDMVQKLMGDMMYCFVCFVPMFDALWVEIKGCIALYFIAFILCPQTMIDLRKRSKHQTWALYVTC